MDWNDLRYFLAVRRAGTLAGAARALGVEHSTVSRRLAALEDALGTKLFLRGPDGFSSTPAGDQIAPLAESMEASAQAVARKVAGDNERVEGTVRLTTSEAFSGFMVKSLARLRARHPALLVEVLSGNKNLDLSRGEADVAVRMTATSDPELLLRKLGVCGWALYATRGYLEGRAARPRLDALAGHDIITYDDTLARIPGALWLKDHGDGANVVLRGNSIVSVLNACIVGMGVTVLPCFMADPEPTLVRLAPDVLGTREMWMVVHPDRARVARVRVVMDFLVELLTEQAKIFEGTVDARS
jgi:DNA-binding transcriptional LysR family regulator